MQSGCQRRSVEMMAVHGCVCVCVRKSTPPGFIPIENVDQKSITIVNTVKIRAQN